jgi:hypothetical protein
MKRPLGVTVIAIANLVAALVWLASKTLLSAQPPQDDLLILLTVIVLFSVGLSLALWKLQNWARWTAIALYILSLIRIPVIDVRKQLRGHRQHISLGSLCCMGSLVPVSASH